MERLNELTRSIGVQATTTTMSTSILADNEEVEGDVKVVGEDPASGRGRGERWVNAEEEYGFTHEELLSFKAKIGQEKSIKCPIEVRFTCTLLCHK